MGSLNKRLRGAMRGGWLMVVTTVLLAGAATASAQTMNRPLHERSPGTAAAPGWPAWQGEQDGRAGNGGNGGNYPPHTTPNSSPYPTPYPVVQPPGFPSRHYPTDRTPALRDLTQRSFSPLEDGARDGAVRQQVFPAPASRHGFGR